jgi:hypothetical protein
MVPLSPTPEADLVSFIRRWFSLLAAGLQAEACAEIDEPNVYGLGWTPDDLQECVDMTFLPGSRFRREHPEGLRFTDPATATGGDGRPDIIELSGGRGYWVDHEVPLNGEWSDLTAEFEFARRADGFAVILHDLHVL